MIQGVLAASAGDDQAVYKALSLVLVAALICCVIAVVKLLTKGGGE